MNLLESDILSQENFDDLLVSLMRKLTMENFREFSRNFEMPLNRGFEIHCIYMIFISIAVVLISAIDIPEPVLMILNLLCLAKMPVCILGEMKIE